VLQAAREEGREISAARLDTAIRVARRLEIAI